MMTSCGIIGQCNVASANVYSNTYTKSLLEIFCGVLETFVCLKFLYVPVFCTSPATNLDLKRGK